MDILGLLLLCLLTLIFWTELGAPLARALNTTITNVPREDVKVIIIKGLSVVEHLGYAYFAWNISAQVLDMFKP